MSVNIPMPHPRGFEQHVLPREPYTQSAPTQKPVPPLINVRLLWRDAFDNRISSIRRVLFGGKYMYLRLLLRDVLSILARNGAERRRSGAWRDGTVTAKLNATTTTRRPPMRTLPEVYCHHYLDRIHQDFGSARKDGETPASNGSGGRADMSLFISAII